MIDRTALQTERLREHHRTEHDRRHAHRNRLLDIDPLLDELGMLDLAETAELESAVRGAARYSQWAVPPPLQRYLACSWTRGVTAGSAGPGEPVLPDGSMDIIWDGRRLFVAGPDTAPNMTTGDGVDAVGVRFHPGTGPLFLGVPADELCDRHVELDGLWPETAEMEDRLAACSTPRHAASVLEEHTLRRVPEIREPDAVVEAASRTWRRGSATADIAHLAEQAGITPRQLHRRFVTAVGYGPKLLQRVLRLQAFLAACDSPAVGLAELALRVGYADQAHLSREARILAGRTPSELRTPRLRVRNVQDPCEQIGYNLTMDPL